MTQSFSNMPRGGESPDKMPTSVLQIHKIEKQINIEITKLVVERQKIMNELNIIENITLRDVLYRRYIRDQTLEEISVDLNYSWRHICRFHGDALSVIEL